MIKKYMILPLLLVLLLCTGLSLGQNANNTSTMENATTNVSAPAASAATPTGETSLTNDGTNSSASAGSIGNATVENATPASSTPNLNYIWSVSGIESGQITMVLNQDGQDLFGQAKYEPDSGQAWNAEVVGTVSGDKVDLTLTSQKENEMTTTKMTGTYANEGFGGSFTQVSGGKMVGKGNFSAMWINPDTSSYTPAAVEQSKSTTLQTNSDASSSIPNSIEITSSSFQPNSMTVDVGTTVTWINHDTKDQVVVASNGDFDSGNIVAGGQYQYVFSKAGTFDYYSKVTPSMTGKIIVTGNSKSRFVDVREYKDKIGPGGDLSGVPPGMGGSGL